MHHSVPQAGDIDRFDTLATRLIAFVQSQPSKVQANLLAFLHLLEPGSAVSADLDIEQNGGLSLRISASHSDRAD